MLDTLQKYGFDLTTLSPLALVELRSIYEREVSALKGEADKADAANSGWVTALTDAVADRADIAEIVRDFKSTVREMFQRIIDADTDTIIPLSEALAELRGDVINEREYWIARIKRENSPTASTTDDDFNEKLSEVSDLAELIRMAYSFIAPMCVFKNEDGTTDNDATAAFAREFPVKAEIVKGQPSGKMLPELSRMPNKRSEAGSGRNASHRFMRFAFFPADGSDVITIPAGTLVADVAHDYVSNLKLGVHVTGPEITKAVKDSGQEWSKPWSVEFPTGRLAGADIRETAKTSPERAESPTGVVLPVEDGEN